MAKQYIKLPLTFDLRDIRQICITERKRKITIDPDCKCGFVTSVRMGEETQQSFEARRRAEKPMRERIEKEAWDKVMAEKRASAKSFAFPLEETKK